MMNEKKKRMRKIAMRDSYASQKKSASGKIPTSKMSGTKSFPVRFMPGIKAQAIMAKT